MGSSLILCCIYELNVPVVQFNPKSEVVCCIKYLPLGTRIVHNGLLTFQCSLMKRNELFKGNERRNCYEVQIKIFNFVYLQSFKLNVM